MNRGINVIIFAVGTAIGAFTIWQILKKKYDKRLQEETQQVWAEIHTASSNNKTEETVNDEFFTDRTEKPDLAEYAERIRREQYNETAAKNVPERDTEHPYIIYPDEYGCIEEYDTLPLTYYEDGVLADDDDNIVYEVDELVGRESLDHIGEFEENVIHVRNDKKRCDYEITTSLRTYSEVIGDKPYKADQLSFETPDDENEED